MTEKEQNTYPKWIHCGLIERNASNHRKAIARGITDENDPFSSSLREVGNALNETADVFSELIQEKEELKKENEKLTVQKLEIRKWVNDKISYLEKKYEFGQTEYKGCPMHNIQFGINILKELQEYWEEQEND